MARAIVIYDADCGFCKWCLAVLLGAGRDGAFRPLPLGTAEADRLLADLSVEERSASWHLVVDEPAAAASVAPSPAPAPPAPSPASAPSPAPAPSAPRRLSAGAALGPAMRFVRGGRIPAAVFDRFPGASERGYRWVVDHRGALGRFVGRRARRWADRVIAAHSGTPQ